MIHRYWLTTPEYKSWTGMKQRCNNPNNSMYHRYGGRGITVCKEWQNDFYAFLTHVGKKPQPDFSLDRINNDGNYEPGNVRWTDRSTQGLNKNHLEVRRLAIWKNKKEYWLSSPSSQ